MPPEPPAVIANAGLATRRALRRTSDRLLPAEFAIFDTSTGIGATQLLGTFAELRLAEALHGAPATAADLAPRVGADPDALHRFLRAAATGGIVHMDAGTGRCRLTRLGDVLREDHPRSQRDWCIYMASDAAARAWGALTHSVRTGESAFVHVHGRSVWEHFGEHPDEERTFAGAMRRLTESMAPAFAAAYPWPAGAVVCDVGGGIGTLLAAVLDRDPSLTGVLVDAPGVLAEAEGFLGGRGLRDRVELVAGDIFTSVEAGADVYLLKDVLHDWDDDRCVTILETVRRAAPTGARVVLAETPQDRNRPHPMASLEDLQMLTQCDGGRQRSIAELHALLRRGGFTPGTVREILSHALIEGVAE
jgi:hypothetical protein